MQIPPVRYLFNDIDRKALRSLLVKLKNKDARFCKDTAEEFFKRKNIDMAVFSIAYAAHKYPDHNTILNQVYLKAYTIHKLALKVNNWYAILGVKDHSAPIEVIEIEYKSLSTMLHPDNCTTAAGRTAWMFVNMAWYVLSDPKKREAHDKRLLTQMEFLEYANSNSYKSSLQPPPQKKKLKMSHN